MKQQSYQICDARYDPLLRQFVREDGHVETIAPIEGKVFLFLLENVGECVERGLIFDRCWGNVIVSEQALTNVISKIRKTLSRVTCGCATIRTVSKTGYSLEIDESIKPSKTETVPSQVTEKVSKTNSLPVEQEVLAATEISTDVNTATVTDSDLKTSSNQQLNSAELEPSNSKSNTYLVKAGYLVALICVVVTAFNLFQTYYTPLPYFIDKAEYRDSYTDNTNHYFFHIAHNESYSLPAITQKLTDAIPSHCNVDVFVRIYPSVDQPENDTLYMLVQKKDGEALNYSASIFNVASSFDSFAQYMEKRSYFCD
ncbi:winged helix-turn-helix domain-containing protein [Vibrio sp. OPT18]|uniref:winged helix-turn-helix domain-containing protein n=1 Tax=Vibrio sp. OPT18 TaxID=2778641 RepID=UPI00188221BB|nr:winged helix-turn-helix domain-containing protein [Vibrio sp. OPT18]MBE8575312.1 winged helix-turn-helix domain-containing protein [Vibrio sp. OPT18]